MQVTITYLQIYHQHLMKVFLLRVYSDKHEVSEIQICQEVETVGRHNEGVQTDVDSDVDIVENNQNFEIENADALENPDSQEIFDAPGERKRRISADQSQWIRERNKNLRVRGKKYVGFSRENGKYQQNINRGERKLKGGCNSNFCRKSKVRKCFQITEAQREVIFNYFWSEMSWDQKKVYVASTVEKISVKRKTQENSRRRQGTFVYYLNVDNKKLRVCRTMFLNTLALGYKTVPRLGEQ
ncbi:uncharacterized protein LOC126734307 isoform X1 [Anthonomus grandis grandis]|uniref:uncharacterized protein LOC126734307 isoform X1 n=1 Tax=Anthonomus grandis grandis TaxID=2921223 RepID=UPI002165F9ED|nr:uncharacterized protein LOC126734307 isoform X1 [Anthonomus grandis grandis]